MAFFVFKRYYILWILLSAFGLNAQSLSKKLDRLKQEIRQSTYYDSATVFKKGAEAIRIARKLKSKKEEALIYQYYGSFYYFSSQHKKAISYFNKSLQMAKQYGLGELNNSTEIRLAFLASEKDLYAAEKSFKRLLKIAVQNNYSNNIPEIYNGLGSIYDIRAMHDEAFNYYLKGLYYAKKTKDAYRQAMLLNNLGLVCINNKQLNQAEDMFEEGLKLIEGKNEHRLAFNLNNNLGLLTKDLKKYNESVNYYKKTLAYAKKNGFPNGIGTAFLNLANSYKGVGNLVNAKLYIDSAISIFTSISNREFLSISELIHASILRLSEKHEMAEQALMKVYAINRERNDPQAWKYYYEESALYHKAVGDFKTAYVHYDRFHTISDSLSDASNSAELQRLLAVFGKEKTESNLAVERQRNAFLKKDNQLKQSRLKWLTALIIMIILAGVLTYYIRHIQQTRKQQKKFTQQLIQQIDEERSRISRDLHDDIGQSLSVIKSKINLFNSGKEIQLEGLDKEIGQVIEQTRNLSHLLHPTYVAKLGLERSLDSLLSRTQESTGVVCSLTIKESLPDLNLQTATQLLRIMQECITNTIKHANATALKISIKHEGTNLMIQYRDNGIGIIENKPVDSGIGLQTISERCEGIGGELLFEGKKGKGFIVELIIPMHS